MAATTAGDEDSASSRIYPCDEGHENTQACPKCMYRQYRRTQLFKKILSSSDIQGKGSYRLYIPLPHAARFCPPTNGSCEVLTFYDVQMKPWPMRFYETGEKAYLAGGWIEFAQTKELRGGDTITLYEVRCGQRAKVFMIGVSYKDRLQILVAPIN